MKILVVPRIFVQQMIAGEREKPSEPWTLISIVTTADEILLNPDVIHDLGPHLRGAQSYLFADTTPSRYARYDDEIKAKIRLFSEKQAHAIVSLIDTVRGKIETLIVHCDAGVSRSGAVGLWANDYLGLKYADFKRQNPHVIPNAYVMSMLRTASGMNPVEESVGQGMVRDAQGRLTLLLTDRDIEVIQGNGALVTAFEVDESGEHTLVVQHKDATDRMQ